MVAYGAVSETGKVWVSDDGPPTLSLLKVQSGPFREVGVVSMKLVARHLAFKRGVKLRCTRPALQVIAPSAEKL